MAQLVDAGLAAFTTPEVCRRAGLSQGALFKHFPTKAELLAAVAEHLFDQLRARFEQSFEALPAERRDLRGGLDLLWEQMLDPRLSAAFELYTAARTDRELQARLEPVVRAHAARILTIAESLIDLGDPVRVQMVAGLAISAMQGLVLNQLALPAPEQITQLRALLEGLCALLCLPVPTLPAVDVVLPGVKPKEGAVARERSRRPPKAKKSPAKRRSTRG